MADRRQNPGREYVFYAQRRKGDKPRWWLELGILFAIIALVVWLLAGCAVDRGCKMECLDCGSVKVDCRLQGETVRPD
jgi:hypothetical protein